MKTKLILLGAVAALVGGCVSQEASFPMTPGEKIIFSDAARANAFRQWSGDDAGHTGRVVTVENRCGLIRAR